MAQTAFQYLLFGVELKRLTNPIGIRLKGLLGNQANDLAFGDFNPVAAGDLGDSGMDATHRRLAEVGDVHADLRAAVGHDAHRLHAMEAAAGGANLLGDGAGEGDGVGRSRPGKVL